MAAPPLSKEQAVHTLAVIREVCEEGVPLTCTGGVGQRSALGVAAERMGLAPITLQKRMYRIKTLYGLEADPAWTKKKPSFFVSPEAAPENVEDLIDTLAGRHEKRVRETRDLIPVHILEEGPIGIAFIGDPHVDDPGCAWGDLRRDVEAIGAAEAVYAIGLGDYRNSWIGRLTKLYADQATTNAQALHLIEWLFKRIPWLALVKGNHDYWHTDAGDPVEFIHRIAGGDSLYGEPAYRLELQMPAGCSVRVHVRHDFPGRSQFNPAHGLVRETLWNYRDHILACGDRHHSGYSPVYHNDPDRRLCHGFRVGTYKDFDHYAREKGFKEENWARSMMAIIDPDFAGDPVRFITPCFSLTQGLEFLAWRRENWKSRTQRSSKPPKQNAAASRDTSPAARARAVTSPSATRKTGLATPASAKSTSAGKKRTRSTPGAA